LPLRRIMSCWMVFSPHCTELRGCEPTAAPWAPNVTRSENPRGATGGETATGTGSN